MFRKTILATAAAGMLAMGGLAASTATASASGPQGGVQFGGPGFNVQLGWGNGPQHGPGWGHHNRGCKPVLKNVKWWDKWGNPRWSKVVVGYNCGPKFGPKPFPGHGGPWGPKPPHHGGGHHGGGWGNW